MGGRRTAASAPEQPQTKHTRRDLGPRRFTVTEAREAWLVTADNLDAVAAWCGGEALHDEEVGNVMYPVDPDTDRHGHFAGFAYVGDVIVRDGDRFYDVGGERFERDIASAWTEVEP